MKRIACQTRNKPRVDSSEPQLPCLGPPPRSGHILKNPPDFGGTEISIRDKTCFLADHIRQPLLAKSVAELGRAAVLPDNSIIDRLARLGIPDNRRLTLVADADSSYVVAVDADLRDRLGNDSGLRSPDLKRIVLDPSRTGKYLREFMLRL